MAKETNSKGLRIGIEAKIKYDQLLDVIGEHYFFSSAIEFEKIRKIRR